ncbi:hypothetical protein DAPPUDRAFT_20190, partial [Daphnia pulex]
WSTWSEWAPCSRTCDGGATYQTRRCMDMVRGCGIHERSIRYQICNMQGKLYNWVPLTDKSTPACSLSCRAVNTSLIVQHAARVHDGTRCKPGSLDMCIDGICQPVGCDLQLNSDSKVDACGVCGGDGSTCLDNTSDDLVVGYRWEFGHRLSPCTVSCDGEVEIICRDAVTGLEVSDQNLCDESSRPQPKFVQCHTDPCPPKWIVGSWESCSVTCGGGVKERRVYCQQGHNNSRVDDVICSALIGHKARTHEPCNTHDCPNWFQGPWSQCSTRCGDDGVQTRVVVCRDARGHVTNACRLQDQPPTSRSCPSQPPCPSTEPPPTTTHFSLSSFYFLSFSLFNFLSRPLTFIAGEWSPCSVTCGDGTREREVNCKIFLEFSKTIAKLPDKECPGLKPAQVEPCFMRPCMTKPSYAVPTSSVTAPLLAHSWKSSGFSQCSASCLGGVQESIIECIREQDGQRVGSHLCPMERRPDAITRTCNDVPCPPRWNTSDFSSCSRTCGGGVQTRDVHCIHEVARGGGNTLPVGADLCPQPPPRAQQYCNMIDCPVEWKTGEWSQCSSTCDGGFKVRKVSCQQILALGQVLTKTANHCNPTPPPPGPAPASASDSPKIQSTNQNFVQQGQSKKKVTLKIGGKATVFKGTQIKIRCPVKHFDKSKINWMKDHILLVKNAKHELNKKGMLRIRDATFSDSGVYSCIAGRSVANITLLWPLQQQPEQSPSSSKKNSKPSGSSSSSRHNNSQRSKLRNASPGHHQQKTGGAKKSVSHPASSSSSVISTKGKADSLKFEWLLTPWSKCSQTCGGSGFQVRAVQCIVRHNNVTKSVEASLCEDAGLANPDTPDATRPSSLASSSSSSNNNRQPATVQKCGLDTCPHWVAGSWTPCHQSRCFTWNTALQKRQLDCVMDNGTLLDAILCSDRDRPSQKRECFNENCRGAWKVSDWSHCSATCDSLGHQSRLLRCVWYGTESPAGMAC